MAVLDRSWYGRVLVERVEGFAEESEWQRAYEEIVAFEEGLAREGMCFVKFWMHISHEEQLKRFERRESIPLKAWKLTDEDWRNREKRPAYEAAVEDMLDRTDHPDGRWHVIPGNSKKYARQAVLDVTIEAAERAMIAHGMQPIAAEELDL
jgi:AMP-polyphosphate phosphotransferase